jgi:hypothetical protein
MALKAWIWMRETLLGKCSDFMFALGSYMYCLWLNVGGEEFGRNVQLQEEAPEKEGLNISTLWSSDQFYVCAFNILVNCSLSQI